MFLGNGLTASIPAGGDAALRRPALLLSMELPSRALAASLSGALLVLSYIVSSLGRVNDNLESLNNLLPLTHTNVLHFCSISLPRRNTIIGMNKRVTAPSLTILHIAALKIIND